MYKLLAPAEHIFGYYFLLSDDYICFDIYLMYQQLVTFDKGSEYMTPWFVLFIIRLVHIN